MRRCKDCRHQNSLEIDGFTDCSYKKICVKFDKNMYERKRRLWFAWWIPKVLLITLALLLGGCVHVKQDGFEYWRFGSQQIGSALLTLPDGSKLLLDGQKSALPTVEITATSITIGGKERNP